MSGTLHQFVDGLFEELDSPRVSAVDSPTEPMAFQPAYAEKAGDLIGHYTLIEILGEGGFGSVWRAEQARPVRREVALKIIKLGMDTREVIARFEAERQALAVLDHPNIAKVFDAGATPTGRPYFVMELVRGKPLTKYCNEHQMALADRLALFADVCRAVQHAHQKGIIHRDLKPSNLLVTLVDGKPVPKVIDFGIAKATGESRLTENTLVTRMDRLMGTPAYMSPEQAEPGMDIDTRSDIYSLGVVLYELLTGQVPFQIGADGKAKRERDARRPSTRIKSFTAEQLQKLGQAQRVEGPKLIGLMKGDLDWIAVKALEQDRARRYDSANAFAEDIRCFLHQKPVSARPPTSWYLLKRFTQRNKLGVSAAAIILITLIAGIATSTWMYFKEKQALVRSEQVAKFMQELLAEAGPSSALGDDTALLLKIMARTAERIGKELADQPLVQIELRHTLAVTYYELKEFPLAIAQADEALRLRQFHAPNDLPGLAKAMSLRGSILDTWGHDEESILALRAAIALHEQLHGPDHERVALLQGKLAWPLMNTGHAAEAETLARRATEAFRKAADPSLMISGTKTLAMILHRTKRDEEAVALGNEMLAVLKKRFGPEHPQIYYILDNLGYDLCALKRNDEAEAVLLEAVRQGEKFFPVHDSLSPHVYGSLLSIAARRNDWAQQIQYARRRLAFTQRPTTPDERDVRAAAAQLARVLMSNAERCLEDARQTPSAAIEATAYLDELRTSGILRPDLKSNAAWMDCLTGYQLILDPTKREEGKTLLARGVEGLKKKTKPVPEDTRRVKKAQAWAMAKFE